MTPSLESQYWTYADSNKEIDKSFERLAFLRDRINKGERIERNMLNGFAFKDQKVIWGLEGMYMGQSPKTTMALALEEITNVEMGLVAAATVGAIMILHKIWTWIYKFFNKIFDRNGTASKGDTALSILDNDDEVKETTAKVTNEVKKAEREIKAEPDDFDGVDAKHLALATKEGMAAVSNLINANLSLNDTFEKALKCYDNLGALIKQIADKQTDFGKPLSETPEFKAYQDVRAQIDKLKEDFKQKNDVIKSLADNKDKNKKEIAAHPAQAFEHLKANETIIFAQATRMLTKDEITGIQSDFKAREDELNKLKAKMETGGEYLPETTKAMADFVKGLMDGLHSDLSTLITAANLVVDNHNALHHLTSKLLSIVKKNDSDNQTLITTLEEGIKTYIEAKQSLSA